MESVGPDAASTMQPKQFLTIFPGVKGSVLQLRDIEQGLDQLNRLPSNNATMRIEPGAEAGSSRVLINNVQKRTWAAFRRGGQPGAGNHGPYRVHPRF